MTAVPDFACRTCAYDLRGLQPDDRCPECGLSVAESIRSDSLVDQDPDWLTAIARGAVLTEMAFAFGLILLILMPLVLVVVRSPPPAVRLISSAIPLAVCSLLCIGTVLLTRREPGRSEPESWRSARRVARVGLAALMVDLVASATGFPTGVVGGLVHAILIVAAVAGTLALIRWMLRLSRRMPDRHVTRDLGIALSLLGVAWPIGLVFIGIGQFQSVLPGWYRVVWNYMLLGCGIATLLGVFAFFSALSRFRSEIRRAVAERS